MWFHNKWIKYILALEITFHLLLISFLINFIINLLLFILL